MIISTSIAIIISLVFVGFGLIVLLHISPLGETIEEYFIVIKEYTCSILGVVYGWFSSLTCKVKNLLFPNFAVDVETPVESDVIDLSSLQQDRIFRKFWNK